ncbi:MAG: hypothetical protein QW629_02955 [Candidatus Bathyarchaeia archaeon]
MDYKDFWNFIRDFVDYFKTPEEARLTEIKIIHKFKQQIAKLAGAAESEEKRQVSWDPSWIKWERTEGARDVSEKSKDVNNLKFKAMLKDLAEYDGKLTREGWFYWVYRSGSTFGRKKAEARK